MNKLGRLAVSIVAALGLVAFLAAPTRGATYGKPSGSGSAGQSPSAVAITGGSIVGVNSATRSVQGAMSSADKAFSDDFDTFQKRVYAVAIADDPTLTGWKSYDLGKNAAGTTPIAANTNDGLCEGGCLTATSGFVIQGFGPTVFQNEPGGHWAIGWRGKVADPSVSGVLALFGVCDPSGANLVVAGVRNSISSTNWVMRIAQSTFTTDGTNTLAADTAIHDLIITDDGTTLRFRVDGVLASSITNRSLLVAGGVEPCMLTDTAGNLIASMVVAGFRAP